MYIPLEQGERVVIKVHRHWFFLATHALLIVLVLVLPFAAYRSLIAYGALAPGGVSAGAAWTLGALWFLVGWTLYFKFWTLYWLDIWVVTDRRLIDIDYRHLFDRDIAILRLDKIQDVQVRVTGVLGNLLKFGAVSVQTAGESREFVIDQIAEPEALRDAIVKGSGASSRVSG
ncbi:MAG TPA: PH domain-containing protein [Candidatus Paceibacterota bacterium]|nr:PH domain-containing protein [Candidatus Paceibacterota bacterium]